MSSDDNQAEISTGAAVTGAELSIAETRASNANRWLAASTLGATQSPLRAPLELTTSASTPQLCNMVN